LPVACACAALFLVLAVFGLVSGLAGLAGFADFRGGGDAAPAFAVGLLIARPRPRHGRGKRFPRGSPASPSPRRTPLDWWPPQGAVR
jgi:hypothetical protein